MTTKQSCQLFWGKKCPSSRQNPRYTYDTVDRVTGRPSNYRLPEA